MIFIASPYTAKERDVMTARAASAREFVAYLTRRDFIVYSPIVHFHGVSMVHNLPPAYEFWKKHSETMLAKAKAVYVLCLAGWKESVGVQDEIAIAKRLDLGLIYWYKNDNRYFSSTEPPRGKDR